MKNVLVLFSMLLSFFSVHGQIDSLFEVYNETQNAAKKIEILNTLTYSYTGFLPDSAFLVAEKAIEIAEVSGTQEALAKCYYLYMRVGAATNYAPKKSLSYEAKSLKMAQNERISPTLRGDIFNVLGTLYDDLDIDDKALEYLLKAETFYIETEDKMMLAGIYNNIAGIYGRSRTFDAKKYYQRALNIHNTINVPQFKVNTLSNYGNLLSVEYPDSAEIYILQALAVAKEAGFPPYTQLMVENKLATLYFRNGDHQLAIARNLKILAGLESMNNYDLQATTCLRLAQSYDNLAQKDSALYFAELAITYNAEEQIKNAQDREIYDFLANLYQKHDNLLAACEMYQKGISLRDTIYNQGILASLAENDVRYETAQREAQIAQQELELAEQKNNRNRLLFGGITLLLATAGIFQFFLYRQRQKKQAVELALAAEAREAERLREMDEIKTNFFTNVSHELRTPLTLITSPLEEAIHNVKQVNLKPDLELAHQNSKKLLGLINEILDLSKLEAGELSTEMATIQPLAFLSRVFFSFQSAADMIGVELDWNTPEELGVAIETDVAKLEKILNNLIGNALKFTPKGGKVSLHLDPVALSNSNSPSLALRISDTGQGIHPNDLPHIFDRFYQSTQPQQQGGTGIGLALSRQLAQLLGGNLNVKSEWQKGSRFLLEIPVQLKSARVLSDETAGDTEAITNASTLTALQFRSGKPQILIVEDNIEMSKYLLDKLQVDYDCHLAENGTEALRLLEQQPFDLITSDVMMPVMDGFALREEINKNNDWRRIPFLLLTARNLEEDKIRGFQLGIDDYITKPFSLPEVKARIRNLLENKLERENIPEDQQNKPEDQLIQQAEALVRARLDDPGLSVEDLAKSLGYSQRNLSRIFTQTTGLTPVKFILEVRLQHARQLLEKRLFSSVAEVRYEVGIESRSYFTTKFKQRFGRNPKEYLQG